MKITDDKGGGGEQKYFIYLEWINVKYWFCRSKHRNNSEVKIFVIYMSSIRIDFNQIR